MKRLAGFTLIELMVTVAVLAVVLGLGVPGFDAMVRESRATTVTNELVAALQLGRSEALKRRSTVVVCRRNAAGTACAAGADWAAGWAVLAGATVIQLWEPPAGQPALAGPNAGLSFRASGLPVAAAAFSVAYPGCSGQQRRSVEVSATGRVSTARTDCP